MSYIKCKLCKEGYFDWQTHKCKPIFFFKHENWGDDFEEIRADSFEEAAENFAKLYNENGDYALMNSSEEVIISDGNIEKKFSVSAEPDINYSVEEIKE